MAGMSQDATAFEEIVSAYYQPLYRFALGLSRSEPDAADLTQRAFEKFGEHGATLRDKSKAKTWLFTTLYRDFLQQKRHSTRFPAAELNEVNAALLVESPRAAEVTDANAAVAALNAIEEPFRSTLTLFYMREHSYREIAEILEVPVGTVMSRIARGKDLLRARMAGDEATDVAATGQTEGRRA